MSRVTLLVAATIAALASTAGADAIRPPPKSCPAGSEAMSSHCGPECIPIRCQADKDCNKKRKCKSTKLCVVTGKRSPCGKVPASERKKKFPYANVVGSCSSGACARGKCVTEKRCVGPADPQPTLNTQPKPQPKPASKPATKPNKVTAKPTPKPTKKKGCQVGGTSGGVWAMALALLLLLRRRRRR